MFVLVILLAIFKDKIAAFFEPHKAAIVNLPGSWAIPIGVLIILSFPPLVSSPFPRVKSSQAHVLCFRV